MKGWKAARRLTLRIARPVGRWPRMADRLECLASVFRGLCDLCDLVNRLWNVFAGRVEAGTALVFLGRVAQRY